jgi:hypothetical protein
MDFIPLWWIQNKKIKNGACSPIHQRFTWWHESNESMHKFQRGCGHILYNIRRSSPSICKVLEIKPTVPNYLIFFPLNTISWNTKTKKKKILINSGQVLGLLSKGHQFESHKPQSYWRLTWSLTSGPVGLVEVPASWPEQSR